MNVFYYQGTKSAYRDIVKSSNTLYFCTDTKELFKGEDLYTDGLRLVGNYASLPGFDVAAEGKLYICEDTGSGYVLNSQGNGWINVIFGTDNKSIEVNSNGLLSVKAVPISSVTGLEERLQAIEADPSKIPIATNKIAGKVKASNEVLVSVDGTMSLGLISPDKIDGLRDELESINNAIIGTTHYKGSVSEFSDLPKNAVLGDIYDTIDTSSLWMYNGSKWISPSGETPGDLKPIAKADINTSQFEIRNNTLNLVNVPSGIVKYHERSLTNAVDEVFDSITWSDFATV